MTRRETKIPGHGPQPRANATKDTENRKLCKIIDLLVGEVGLRTYEGLASGFTVRPLCRSGHSPAREDQVRGRKRPGNPEAGRGEAYVA